MRKNVWLNRLIIVSMILTGGCGSGGGGPDSPHVNRTLKLVFVQHALCKWDTFWCTVEQGIKDAAEQMNVEVTILGPDEFDLQRTAAFIDEARASKPDGIALTVTDPVRFKDPIQRAIDARIPVVAYNSGSGPEEDGIAYLTYVGMDEYQGGYQGAQRLIDAGGTNGVCINHQVGHAGLAARCRGFLDRFSEAGLPAEELGIGSDLQQAQAAIADFYSAHPDVDTFLTLGHGATPFYAFAEAEGLSGKVLHGTFDLSAEIEQNIDNGVTLFGIDQQPYWQGYAATMWLSMVVRYGITPVLPVTPTGPLFVDADTSRAQPDPDKPLELVLVQHARCDWDSFWCVVENGIRTAADQMDVEVTVLGPDQFDLERTASLIDEAVSREPDGIGVTVTDASLFRDPIERGLQAGIPVVAYNSGAGPAADGIAYLTFLGQDEYLGGHEGARRLIAAGGSKGVCINHQAGHTGLDARCQGFVDAFAEDDLEAEVLIVTDDAMQAQDAIDDYYSAHPDTDSFLTVGPTGATAFYAFARSAGLDSDSTFHGTFDLSPEIVENIKSGVTAFAIDQQPFLQGYSAVMTLALLNRQGIEPVLPITPTGPGFVDLSNIDVVEALAGVYR